MVNQQPPFFLTIEFGNVLQPLAGGDHSLARRFRETVEMELGALLESLGVPGRLVIELSASSSEAVFRLWLNGERLRFSDELFRLVWEYVACATVGELPVRFSAQQWLSDPSIAKHLAEESPRGLLITEFLSRLALEAIKLRPERLLGKEQAAAYLAGLKPLNSPLQLFDVLRRLLRLRISIANAPVVEQTISEAATFGWSEDAVAEALIARLRPHWMEIILPPEELNRYHAATSEQQRRDTLTLLADGVFYELGIRIPEIRFATSSELKPGSFKFKLNDLETLPRLGLGEAKLLVNDTPDRLKLIGIPDALPALNPGNDTECGLIAETQRDLALAAGLTGWNPFEYLIIVGGKELRRHAGCLLDVETVEYEMARLREYQPELIDAAAQTVSPEHLTRVLQELLEEDISIRDLRGILQRAIVYDEVVGDPSTLIFFDDRQVVDPRWSRDRMDFRTQFVRSGLKRFLGHKYTRGQNTLLVLLLDPEIEARISDHLLSTRPMAEDEVEKILAAVRQEVESVPASVASPVILTVSTIRSSLRGMIAA
ncbi:MAG: FHIPEP family type III secretion protein, partial [Blastocatellia bacterium]